MRVPARSIVTSRVDGVQRDAAVYKAFRCSSVISMRLRGNQSLGSLVRCCSLDTVAWIARRSCPSLGLSDDRGAEIARHSHALVVDLQLLVAALRLAFTTTGFDLGLVHQALHY